jgi:PAS domain S-box-containing protein
MGNEPEIVKILRDEEKLGKLHSKRKNGYEEVTTPEMSTDRDANNINGFIVKDISKKIENEELRTLEGISHLVFENSAVAITITDECERIIYWNKYAEQLLGMNKDDLYMKPVSLLYPSEEWSKIRKQNIRQKGMQHHLETKILRKNNELQDVDISLSVLKDQNGEVIGSIGIIKDITERKQIEKALKESEEKFKQLYEKAPISYHILSPHGEITDVNEKWCQILRYTKVEVTGKPIFDFISENEKETAGLSFFKKIQAKNPYAGGHERTFVTKDGEKRIFVIHDFFSFDENNNIKSVHTAMEDITNRKQMETELKDVGEMLRTLNIELERKVHERTVEIENLLKQKDEFISQLGHDLKTPLSILINILPLVKNEVEDKNNKEDCDVAIRNVYYIKNLVTETLKIAELSSPKVTFDIKELNLLDVVNNVVTDNQFILDEKNFKIENHIDEKIIVEADELRLREIFNNIINNAVKYSGSDGGTITLDAQKEKNVVTISVRDTGVGITKEQLDHVFDEFYKADESRHNLESSGLGLSICKRIVEKHGGRIWVESPGLGKGTTFYFTLKLGNKNV